MLWGPCAYMTSMALPLSTDVVNSITEGHYVIQAVLALGEAVQDALIHSLSSTQHICHEALFYYIPSW